jgi:hypothetical protein
MPQNEGTVDRIIRIILGVVIAILGIVFKSWWGLVAIIPLATGITGFCGIYALLHISTLPKKGK